MYYRSSSSVFTLCPSGCLSVHPFSARSSYMIVNQYFFINLFRWRKEGGGVALMHVYVWEHIVSLYYRTVWWMFTKLDRDEVLMVLHLCLGFTAKSAQGWIQGGAKIGQWGVPSPKDFFFRLEGYSNKPNAWQWSKSLWEEALLVLVPFWSQIFDTFLTSFWTKSFWCILIQFL